MAVGQGTVPSQQEVLCLQERLEVVRVVSHNLRHMVKPIVLYERIYK